MRTNLMRCFAVALGMSAMAAPYAQAQYGQAPQVNAYGNGYLTATGGNLYGQQQVPKQGPQPQTRQPAASRWNSFNAPAQQQSPAPQQQYAAPQQQYSATPRQPQYGATQFGMPQQQYNAPAQQTMPGRQVFRQVSQQDDLLLPPRTSAPSSPESIGPGLAQPLPYAQPTVQQQVPARGSYQPAPANQHGPAYESSPSDRPAPAYESDAMRSQPPAYAPAPTQPRQPAPSYAPQADPYSNAPSANYAPTESTILEPSHATTGPSSHYPVNPYGSQYSSPYSSAMSSGWDEGCGTSISGGVFSESFSATRPALFPYFGGANVLFLNTADNSKHALAITRNAPSPFMPSLFSNSVSPGSATGYEISAGRYIKCGNYGLGFTYFNFDPDSEERIINGTAGDIRSSMQGYHDYHLDLAGANPADQVYNHITGASADTAGALNVRASRDLDVQGLELNLFSFGLMGYGRSTPLACSSSCGSSVYGNPCDCGGSSCGSGSSCGGYGAYGGGHGGLGGRGFGRLGGPLTRPAANRVQIVTSHGLRWFQIRDDAELAYNIDGIAGYQSEDIYDNVNVENNLYGYQFGTLLNYCVSRNLNLNIGGKFGVYVNDVEANRRVGTQTIVAYREGLPLDVAMTSYDDTVLATLGEVNCGLGYRLGNAWTINGGYRVIGASGIATGFNQMAQDFGTSARPGHVHANDSLLLHGAYVGANFNW